MYEIWSIEETPVLLKEKKKFLARHKNEKIKGFDYDNQKIYKLIEGVKPPFDSNIEKIKPATKEYTDFLVDGYFKVYVCTLDYEVKPLSKNNILINLEISLANHKAQYTAEKQRKHLIRLNNPNLSASKRTWIESLHTWLNALEDSFDLRETALRDNDIIPPFTWESMPVKT